MGDYFGLKFCYECCRSNLRSSDGSIETLKKYLKPTKLDGPVYFCSGYCKARIIENLKSNNLLVTPTRKTKTSIKTESFLDDITSQTILNNTPGINRISSTGNLGGYKRKNLNNLKNHRDFEYSTLEQQIDAYRQDKKFGVYKEISMLSLRNEKFNLPLPELASHKTIGTKIIGVNQSSENYSFN